MEALFPHCDFPKYTSSLSTKTISCRNQNPHRYFHPASARYPPHHAYQTASLSRVITPAPVQAPYIQTSISVLHPLPKCASPSATALQKVPRPKRPPVPTTQTKRITHPNPIPLMPDLKSTTAHQRLGSRREPITVRTRDTRASKEGGRGRCAKDEDQGMAISEVWTWACSKVLGLGGRR